MDRNSTWEAATKLITSIGTISITTSGRGTSSTFCEKGDQLENRDIINIWLPYFFMTYNI